MTESAAQPFSETHDQGRRNSRKRSFLLLEALRGIAALLVVTRHVPGYSPIKFPTSYLAVDLFFVLSGFVLSYSYEADLRSGTLGKGSFFLLRIIRLYPLYILFTAIGCMAAVGFDGSALRDHMADLGFSALFLPHFQSISPLFPFDHPSWSLFFELVISFVYGAVLLKLSTRGLACLAIGCFVALAYGVFRAPQNLDIGWLQENFAYGFARVGFSFIVGMLIYRDYAQDGSANGPPVVSNRISVVIAACATLVMAAPLRHDLPYGLVKVFDLFAIAVVFPLVILHAVRFAPQGALAKISEILGIVSFPVYVAHVPIFRALNALSDGRIGDWVTRHAPMSGLAYAFLLVPICVALDRYLDLPLRRRLKTALKTSGLGRSRVPGLRWPAGLHGARPRLLLPRR